MGGVQYAVLQYAVLQYAVLQYGVGYQVRRSPVPGGPLPSVAGRPPGALGAVATAWGECC